MTESSKSNAHFVPTERQRAIHEALSSKNPELGRRYLGALHAIRNTGNPDRVAQAAHSARELVDILPGAFSKLMIDTAKSRRSDIMMKGAGAFLKLYRKDAPHSHYKALGQWLANKLEHGKDRKTELEDEFIGADLSERKHKPDLAKIAKDLNDLRNQLAQIAHHKPTTEAEVFRLIEKLETILSSIAMPYFETEAELELLLKLTDPTKDDFERLKGILAKSALIERFYRQATNPKWFPYLRDDGRFADPAPVDRKGDLVGCPEWPHAVYLERCIDSFPDDILNIILSASTDNPRVHQQLAAVATLLPPSKAKSLVGKATGWLASPYLRITLLPEQLAKLAVALLVGGEPEKGFELARVLLDVTIDEPRDEVPGELSFLDTKPEARSRIDDWQYEQALELLIPAMKDTDPSKTINLLSDVLSSCIKLDNSVRGEPDDHDFSYIWRPAIEDHEQNHAPHDVKHVVLLALRDVLLDYVGKGKKEAQSAYELLNASPYPIFRRLELFLLANEPAFAPHLLEQVVANPEAHYGSPTHHEYSIVLQSRFDDAGKEAQALHLAWIDDGPDIDTYRQRFQEWAGRAATEDGIQKYQDAWRRDKLSPIMPYMPEDRQRQYKGLLDSVGPPEHPDFLAYSQSWSGPTSPVGSSDIADLTPEKVFEYLQTWTPDGKLMSPSPDGLGRALATTVQARPREFSTALAPELAQSLRPTYLFWIFHALRESLKNNSEVNWDKVLQLAQRITSMSASPVEEPAGEEMQTSWESVHKAVASLMSAALERDGLIPTQYRKTVWCIIEPLTRSPQPSLEYETQYGGSNSDPVTMSINTTRGDAAHALFRYMRWANLQNNPEHTSYSIPEECLPVLDRLLDPASEPTLTIRSVVGWYLPLLCGMDLEWVKAHLHLILPTDPSHANLREAVFEGYFTFNRASTFLFRNLPELFQQSFDWAMLPEVVSSFHHPKRRFVEHVLELYWNGIEQLDDAKSLIRRLYALGEPELRAYATEFVGRSTEYLFPQVPGHPDFLERIRNLWDWRARTIGESDPKDHQEELKSFGWWIAHARVDSKWILDRAVETLSMTGGAIDYAHAVLKRLPELTNAAPLQAAKMLDSLVRGDKEGWGIAFWETDTAAAFDSIKQTAHSDAWEVCVGTINYLGERGYSQYKSLLD